ncbi:unnamed protein product [Nezara viridula]|uniref:Uncharacterized protein n=1 Tax=Nezara viridula TaxID=85310 RepID=A0A9P0DY56_NEZVI|nr:unnamed protein product [Nezara viridula]
MANLPKGLSSIFTISRLLGLMPVTSAFTVSKRWFIISIIIYLPLSLFDLAHLFIMYTNLPESYDNFKKFIIVMSGIYCNISTLCYLLTLILKINILKQVLLKMEKLEGKEEKILNLSMIWFTFLDFYLVFNTVTMFGIFTTLYCNNFKIIFKMICHIVQYFRSIMIIYLYCLITRFAGSAVGQLKKTLRPSVHQVLCKLRGFNETVLLIQLNNEFFSCQTLLIAVRSVVMSTLRLYKIFYMYRNNWEFNALQVTLEILDPIGTIVWLLAYSASVSYFMNSVSICYKEYI